MVLLLMCGDGLGFVNPKMGLEGVEDSDGRTCAGGGGAAAACDRWIDRGRKEGRQAREERERERVCTYNKYLATLFLQFCFGGIYNLLNH